MTLSATPARMRTVKSGRAPTTIFAKHLSPSTTASSVQVRQKVHTDSVARWRRYEKQLEPLRLRLEAAGIETR